MRRIFRSDEEGMTRDDARQSLLSVLGAPQEVEVAVKIWLAAAALGGLRQAANDSIRSSHRSRGDAKNARGDLQGSFGELVVATEIERALDNARITFRPLNWDRPGDEVDAAVEIGGHRFLVEAKCHLHEQNKKWYLVNAVAAERSRARGARSFVPVFSRAGAGVALLGRPLLVSDVHQWPLKDFGYRDAARAADLVRIFPSLFNCTLTEAVERVGGTPSIDLSALIEVASSARRRFSELRAAGLEIGPTPVAAAGMLSRLA
jgi:hypothetical protein